MKSRFLNLFRPLAANNQAQALVANGHDGGAVFELSQPDSMFIPYGSFRHKLGQQIFDRKAAEDMIAANNGMLAKLGRALGGKNEVPVYVGHPDIPGSKDTDKRAYGWADASGMIAENEGLRIPVRWSDAGNELVANAHFRFYSPAWWLGKTTRGLVPTGIKSIGLTNDPNIPVPALANEMQTEDLETEDGRLEEEVVPTPPAAPSAPAAISPELIEALGLTPEATEEEILAAVQALKDAATAANTAKTEAETAKVAADGCKTEAETAKAAAEEKTTLAENERNAAQAALKIATDHAVQAAVICGRITPAEADAKATEILAANDLAVALQDLGKMPTKVKTVSTTGDLGNAKAKLVLASNDAASVAKAERAQLVANEFDATNPAMSVGERKRTAWRRAQAKRPELFSQSPAEQA